MSYFEFRRQLAYKAAMRGGQVVVGDRFCANSKTFLACGHKQGTLPLAVLGSIRLAGCVIQDRDVSAAIKMKRNNQGLMPALGDIHCADAEENDGQLLTSQATTVTA